jgi:hypothetical protein
MMQRRETASGTVHWRRDLALLVTPVIASAGDAASWLARALPSPGAPVVSTTRAGWPMTVLHGEKSLAAHVRILDFAGGVVAHFDRESQREEVLALMAAWSPELPVRNAWQPFAYAPPPGWQRGDRAGQTLWIAPSAGARPIFVRVFDAVPVLAPRRTLADAARIRLPSGLCAEVVSQGGARARTEAVVSDARYVYRFQLDCDPGAFTDATRSFARLVSSLRPTWRAEAELTPFTTWND